MLSNIIFRIIGSTLFLKSSFQVLQRSQLLMILINQLQSEISHHPQKRRHIVSQVISISFSLLRLQLDMLRQVHHQRQTAQRILINRPSRVIYKEARQQQSQTEYSHIVVIVLVEATYSLRVHNQYIYGLSILSYA